jgi:phosphoglycerate kinase
MIKLLKDAPVKGKKVILRLGYDVPIKNGKVVDNTRIKESLPTLNYLLGKGAKVIIITHQGRPDGKAVEELRLSPVAEELARLIGKPVKTARDCIGAEAKSAASSLKEGEILMLENLRFHREEEANDPQFSKQLASLGDIYVNDAFSVSHRAHASIEGITKFLPGYAGFLLQKEIEMLGRLIENPEKPFIALLGGAKVSDKIGVITSLSKKADSILIGGAMQFTFLKAQGKETGTSIMETEKVEMAKKMLKTGKIVLPVDAIVADSPDSKDISTVVIDKIPAGKKGLDIGSETVKLFSGKLAAAKTIVWNGPVGMFEKEAFSKGTVELAKAIASSRATTVIGGGDTIAAAEKAGVKAKFTFVSTGGGAMLEFLEGKELPGIAALTAKNSP